jgi:hypothetical protein
LYGKSPFPAGKQLAMSNGAAEPPMSN